jgi:uncharacterized SAM-binding protein YcdF (DUF218 family)
MFILSKLVDLFAQPLAWVVLLLLANVLMARHPARSRALSASALGVLMICGWLPLPDALIRNLETHYAELPVRADLHDYVGMVVLGGSTDGGDVARDHMQPALNSAAERLFAPLPLLQANPHLQLIYSGGNGSVQASGPSEAELAQRFFQSVGIAGPAVRYESASRTTHENAVLSAKLPGVDIHQRWVLITSAWHMPRAMATFAQAGWNVTAYPVDFRTGTSTPWTAYSLQDGLRRWQLVLHELLGIAAYRIIGHV